MVVPSFKDLEEKDGSVAISHRNLQISTTKLHKIRINIGSDTLRSNGIIQKFWNS